jgi:hypothetical protein
MTPYSTHLACSSLHRLVSLTAALLAGLGMAALDGSPAAAAPKSRPARFQSWATLGGYERTALAQGSSFRMSLPTRDGGVDLAFHPADVRAQAYQAEVVDRRGRQIPVESPQVMTFTGSVIAGAGDRDFAKLTQLPDGTLSGLLRADGVLYELRSDESLEDSLLWVREMSAADLERAIRGSASPDLSDVLEKAFVAPLPTEGAELREIELATEADARFVAECGGVDEALARTLSIVNAMNGFYENDFGLTHRVVYQRAWSFRDPYPSRKSGKLVKEFRARFSRDITASYDAAQLFSGRNLEEKMLGRSFAASVCGGYRYGVSQGRGLDDASIALVFARQQAQALGARPDGASPAGAAELGSAAGSDIAEFVAQADCIDLLDEGGAPMAFRPMGPQLVAEGDLLEIDLGAGLGAQQALTFDLADAPAGASVSHDGRFLYVPPSETAGCNEPQEVWITLVATGPKGEQAMEIVPILVLDRPGDAAPELRDPRDLVTDAGQLVWIPLVASDVDGDALTFYSPTLPSGAFLDGSGVFLWQPTNQHEGLHEVVFEVADCSGRSSSQTVSIQVNRVPAPQLSSLSQSSGDEGTLVEITGIRFEGSPLEVSFGGAMARVQSASSSRLVVQAPRNTSSSATVEVTVWGNGIVSDNSLEFTYPAPGSGGAVALMSVMSEDTGGGR